MVDARTRKQSSSVKNSGEDGGCWSTPEDVGPQKTRSIFTYVSIPHKTTSMEIHGMLLLLSSALFFLQSTSATVDTISANQTIKDGNTIVSNGQMYELGFFSPGNSKNRYLGIWYKKISTGTVVWVANRDTPITDTSGTFQISRDGNLLILSGRNTMIWSSNSTVSVTSNNISPVAQLLDTGNLVVWENMNDNSTNRNVIWESFDYPGNTLLPGMKVGKDLVTGRERYLTSWKSPDDPSIGPYNNRIDTNGYPQMFGMEGLVSRFRLGPWNGVRFRGFPIENPNPINLVEFVVDEKEIYYRYQLKSSVLQRMLLTSDGTTQTLNWIERIQEWVVYGNVVVDTCARYGRCGPYATCSVNKYPPCSCMEGFEPRVPEEWNAADLSEGCERTKPLDCENGNGNGDGFREIVGMKFPDTRRSWYNVSMTLGECEMACKRNCSCTAYASLDIRRGGSGCLLWFDELMDIREYEEDQVLYVRTAASELAVLMASQSGFNKNKVLIVVLPLSSAALLMSAVAYVVDNHSSVQMENVDELPFFSIHKIANATDNFNNNNKIGEGGFGPSFFRVCWKMEKK